MCFSANASFGAGVVLSTIGVLCLKPVKSRSLLPFAAIPLIFAAQQFTEGFLWLALADPVHSSLQAVPTYIFLIFAQVVWPTWVPFSVLMMEKDKKRKDILKIITWVGMIVSLYLAYCLLKYHVAASISDMHISYEQDYPVALSRFGGFLYLAATIAPPLLSTTKWTQLVGLAIFISYIMTSLFYEDYIVSVWCFFASVISLAVYLVVRGERSRGVPETTKAQSSNGVT